MALGVAAAIGGLTVASLVWSANLALAPMVETRGQDFYPSAHRHFGPSPAYQQERDTRVALPGVGNTSPNIDEEVLSLRGTAKTSVDTNLPSPSGVGSSPFYTSVNISELASQYSIKKRRTFDGPRLDFENMVEAIPRAASGNDEGTAKYCKRWAVLTTCSSTAGPTDLVKQLSMMEDWCVVVVSDKDGELRFETMNTCPISTS